MRSVALNATAACPEFREKLGATYLAVDPDCIDIPQDRLRNIDPNSIKDLANSIAQVGLLEPVGLKLTPNRTKLYEVIYGARRVMACQLLLRTAVANSENPNHDPEVFRFSEMHALRYPKEIPDYLIKILEIRENLDRQELTTKEKTAHLLTLAAIVKESGVFTENGFHGNRENPKTSKPLGGRPVNQVEAKVSEESGVDRNTLSTRLKSAEPITGPIDMEQDTVEQLREAASKLKEAAAKEKAAKQERKESQAVHVHIDKPEKELKWFRKRFQDGDMTMDQVRAYASAWVAFCRECEAV